MSVEVTNETVWQIDGKVFSDLGIWVMDQMRVSTQSDLTIMFVDPDPIAQLHMRWMNLEGPTDVMSFPMDELRPGDGRTVMEGVLGDIVICPWVAAQQALAEILKAFGMTQTGINAILTGFAGSILTNDQIAQLLS